MPANAKHPKKSIQQLYTEGMQEVSKIISHGSAAQREVALQTLDDLTAMMLAHTIETVQGRTALLTGLIAELTQVIEAVNVQPPYMGAVKAVTKIVDSARSRLAAEKKKLLPPNA